MRVDRPGDRARAAAEASRAREFGPKARWTCRVQRSPPKRGDETSRDRLPPRLRYAPRLRSPDDDDDLGSEPSLAPSSDGDDTTTTDGDRAWGWRANDTTASTRWPPPRRSPRRTRRSRRSATPRRQPRPARRGTRTKTFPPRSPEEEEERVTDARTTSTERVARQRTRERTRSRSPIRQIRVDAVSERGASPRPSRFSRHRERPREISPRLFAPRRVTRGRGWSPPRDRWHDRDARRRPSRSRSPSPRRRRRPSSWSPSRRRRRREDDWNPADFPWNPANWNASHRDPYASPAARDPHERRRARPTRGRRRRRPCSASRGGRRSATDTWRSRTRRCPTGRPRLRITRTRPRWLVDSPLQHRRGRRRPRDHARPHAFQVEAVRGVGAARTVSGWRRVRLRARREDQLRDSVTPGL